VIFTLASFELSINSTYDSLNFISEKGTLSPLLVSSLIENPNPTSQDLSLSLFCFFGKSEIFIVPLTLHSYFPVITAFTF